MMENEKDRKKEGQLPGAFCRVLLRERSGRAALVLLPVLISFLCMTGLSVFWLHASRQACMAHISGFCTTLIEDAPAMEAQVLSSLKSYCESGAYVHSEVDFLAQYGYDGSEFGNGIQQKGYMLLTAALLAVSGAFFASGCFLYQSSRRRIDGLTEYLEQVNSGAAQMILQNDEDCFSHLQDEIYKTVTNLYQTRNAAVKAKQNFADNLANIAHQLKTPITAAFLSLQLMELAEENDFAESDHWAEIRHNAGQEKSCAKQKEKKLKNHAGQIRRQLARLNCLEEALLTLSRIDAGTLRLERTKVDAYTVLNLAAENLEELMKRRNVSVEIPEGEAAAFCGDPEWTMEAVMNLMKNCMEHSGRGGTIHCRYSQNPLYTELLIWDEGRGFAAEDLPHLFDRFYRGKGAAGNGIGIGLSLARSILELQNGSVTARNLPEGGACFEVRLYAHAV